MVNWIVGNWLILKQYKARSWQYKLITTIIQLFIDITVITINNQFDH
jgi:hypothetical protein